MTVGPEYRKYGPVPEQEITRRWLIAYNTMIWTLLGLLGIFYYG